MTKKERIIKAIEEMHISMLEVLLDDDKTYQNASKTVFLEKLGKAFYTFQNETGDTKLVAHKGVCNHNGCVNKGCKGFAFVGNNSKIHLDFIFEEDEGIDYKDIRHCNDLWFLASEEVNHTYFFDIAEDEKADFKPETDFLLLGLRCKKAIEELRKYAVLDRKIYVQWLAEYEDLFEETREHLNPFLENSYWGIYSENYLEEMGFLEFGKLFDAMEMFRQMLSTNHLAGYVVRNFDLHFKAGNEEKFKEWIAEKYPEEPWGVYAALAETLEDKTFRTLFSMIQKEFDETLEERTYFLCENLKIDTTDFQNLLEFERLQNRQRAKVLQTFPPLKNLI